MKTHIVNGCGLKKIIYFLYRWPLCLYRGLWQCDYFNSSPGITVRLSAGKETMLTLDAEVNVIVFYLSGAGYYCHCGFLMHNRYFCVLHYNITVLYW